MGEGSLHQERVAEERVKRQENCSPRSGVGTENQQRAVISTHPAAAYSIIYRLPHE